MGPSQSTLTTSPRGHPGARPSGKQRSQSILTVTPSEPSRTCSRSCRLQTVCPRFPSWLCPESQHSLRKSPSSLQACFRPAEGECGTDYQCRSRPALEAFGEGQILLIAGLSISSLVPTAIRQYFPHPVMRSTKSAPHISEGNC